jgi:hypothetical protein
LVGFRTRLNAVWLQRDDISAAERELEEAIGTWTPPTSSYHYQHFYALIGRCELALYRGDARRAYEHFQADLPRLRRSLLSRVAVSNIVASQLRARAAIAEARRRMDEGRPSEARPLMAEARREMRHLRRLDFPLAQALVPLLEAGVAELGGDKAGSIDALRRAVAIEDRVEMRLYAAAARFRLARALGGSEGDDLRAEAASWMQRQRIESPERWTLMLAPGWRD